MAEFLGGMLFCSSLWIIGLVTLYELNKRGKLGRFTFTVEFKKTQP